MAEELKGKKIAFLAADMFEEVELAEPWKALEEAGAELELVSLEDGEIQGFNHYDKAGSFKVDKAVEEASANDYDGLVTSRKPDDIPAFNKKAIEEFAEGRHQEQAAKTSAASS